MRFKLGTLLWAFGLANWAQAEPFASSEAAVERRAQCDVQESSILGRSVRWCFERSRPEVPPSPGESVVYFMHGLSGNAQSWSAMGYEDKLLKLRSRGNYPPVTFVSFDTSESSFFSDFGGVPNGPRAYETWFTQEFIPFVESKLKVCHERQCRSLIGVSMGGWGALKTALRHSQMFSSVAVNSPALSPFNVFEKDEKWAAYFGRHPIGSQVGMYLLSVVRSVMKNRDNADYNDPAWLVENFSDPRALPSIYFDMGDHDDFGFEEGYQRLKTAFDRRGFAYEGHLVPGANHSLYAERSTYLLQFIGAKLAGTWGRLFNAMRHGSPGEATGLFSGL